MSGFSAAWLALREPADTDARPASIASFVAPRVHGRFLDLGGGTGANIRYLSSRLPSPHHWTIVDDDEILLQRAPAEATVHRADLNAVVDDAALFEGCSLVTAAALLDLVSGRWLAKLVERCRDVNASVLFALSYDGRVVCAPEEPEDDEVRRLVNQHQKHDKGFGQALGADAAARAVELLTAAGYTTKAERSDWRLAPDSRQLQRELVAGWASAAAEIAPARRSAIEAWQSRRLAHIDAEQSRIVVGHVDVAARLA